MSQFPTYDQLMLLMASRYSCRKFDPNRKIDLSQFSAVIEAAGIAPSACNRQPWEFLAVSDEKGLEAIAKSYDRDWIKNAPGCIIALANHNQSWHRPSDGKDHSDIDLSIAIEHICLAATTLGLGTCWVCNFDTDIIRQTYNFPENIEPVALIPIGFPTEGSSVPQKVRKSTDEILKWQKY